MSDALQDNGFENESVVWERFFEANFATVGPEEAYEGSKVMELAVYTNSFFRDNKSIVYQVPDFTQGGVTLRVEDTSPSTRNIWATVPRYNLWFRLLQDSLPSDIPIRVEIGYNLSGLWVVWQRFLLDDFLYDQWLPLAWENVPEFIANTEDDGIPEEPWHGKIGIRMYATVDPGFSVSVNRAYLDQWTIDSEVLWHFFDIINGDMEQETGWLFSGGGLFDRNTAYSGVQSLRLDYDSTATSIGVHVVKNHRVDWEFAVKVLPDPVLGVWFRAGIVWDKVRDSDDDVEWLYEVNTEEGGTPPLSWTEISGTIDNARGFQAELVFEHMALGDPNAKTWIDAVRFHNEFDFEQELLTMKSTATSFLLKLIPIIEAIDPNIGTIFKTGMIWRLDEQLKTDAASFQIATEGIFDGAGRVGNHITRFWFADIRVEPTPLTNGSSQYRNVITLTAFYHWEDDNSQEENLRVAAIEILDALNDSTIECQTLNTGEGYMGFLHQRPRMLTGIEAATIGDGAIAGHSTQLEVTFFEEVPY